MTHSVEQIQHEIALLDQALSTLAEAFQNAYADYLSALGQAVRKQHILAAYQVCTQGYPQQFLGLSLSQQQGLQQALRDLAKQAQFKLLEQLHPFQQEEAFKHLEQSEISQSVALVEVQPQTTLEQPELEKPALEAMSTDGNDFDSTPVPVAPSAPKEISLSQARLVQWQIGVEQGISKELAAISHQTNRLLQQSNILSSQLPDALLQHASKTELADGVPRSPNLLNVLVEAANNAESTHEEEGKTPELLQVLAIHLRLVEIEFADPPTMAARSKIRELTARLKKLGQDYRKKHREYAIAAAQDAWRASWFED
jgi:hypothetical protein